jgi:hypothetical protein
MDSQLTVDLGLILPRLLLDVIGISILLMGLYFRNYRRADLVAVYLACNIGLFSVLTILSFSPVSSAVGFALFGVLSIIRLRSFEFLPTQIAYFFISLAIALICATDMAGLVLPIILVVVMLVAMAIVDGAKFRAVTESSVVVLDVAIPDSTELKAHLNTLLGAEIINMNVTAVNLLQETTTVEVTYRRIKK